jgi:hypothetical protein
MFRISWIIWFQLENVREAKTFQALWHFAEGLLFFFKLFLKKEGFLKLVSNFNISEIEYLYHIFEL